MLETVTKGFRAAKNRLAGKSELTPDVVDESLRDIRVSLLEARARQCRFIVSESVREAVCCGAPTSETSSWCAWHRHVVFTPYQAVKDRRKAA